MVAMTPTALFLALLASPVAGMVNLRKGFNLQDAVQQRQRATIRARARHTNVIDLLRHSANRQHALLGSALNFDGQDLEVSADELQSVAGLSGEALGRAASLSENGYRAVAEAHSRAAMQAFVTRILEQEGLEMTRPRHLEGVLKYYDGECATQSYENLINELRDGVTDHMCHEAWIARKDGAALLQEETQVSEVWDSVVAMEGAQAPLNEEGYQGVAAKHDNKEMSIFIERLMRRDGLRVNNTDGLAGFVPYFSGECATQSFEALLDDIHCLGPAAVTANVTYQLSAEDAPSADQLRKSIAAAAGIDESVIVISGMETTDNLDASEPKNDAAAPEAAPIERHEATPLHTQAMLANEKTKTSKTIKIAITTEDATVLSHIRKSMKDVTSLQAHLDAFDADVDIEVKPDFDVVSVTPSSCGGGWLTAA